MNPLAARVIDGLGRAQQRMIRAQDRTLDNAANGVGTRRAKRRSPHSRESVAYGASIRGAAVWSWHTHGKADQTSRLAAPVVSLGNQVVERQFAAILRS